MLKKYDEFNGDIDMFARIGAGEKINMTDRDWFQIENFIQNLILIQNDLVAGDYKNKLLADLNENVEPGAMDFLKKLAEKKE